MVRDAPVTGGKRDFSSRGRRGSSVQPSSRGAAGARRPRGETTPSPRLHLIRVLCPLGRVSVGIPLPRRHLGACLEFVAFLGASELPIARRWETAKKTRLGAWRPGFRAVKIFSARCNLRFGAFPDHEAA